MTKAFFILQQYCDVSKHFMHISSDHAKLEQFPLNN